MKKSIFILSGLTILLSIFILACSNNETRCESCEGNYSVEKIKFYGSDFESKKFDDENGNNSYYHINIKSINELRSFNNLNLIDIDLLKTKCIVVLNKVNDKNSSNGNIELNNESIVFLFEKGSNYYNVKIFNKNHDEIKENVKFSNFKTTTLITNDLHNIAKIIFNSEKYNIYTFITEDFTTFKEGRDELNLRINGEMAHMRLPIGDKCASPCPKLDGNLCKTEGGMYICGTRSNGGGGNSCAKNRVQEKLEDSDIFDYNFTTIDDDLHSFRDAYLSSILGGDKVIDDYYFLSDKLPLENITLDVCKKTFNLIESEIVPLSNDLRLHPNSTSVLIDNARNEKLIQYLYEIKQIYPDQSSKDKIQNIINKVNYFTNKSNLFITNNLRDY